ncbi:MAG: MFS transporter [Myxococcota bacterium]
MDGTEAKRAPSSSEAPRPGLFPVLLVNFIATFGFSVVIPFLIFVVRDLGGNGVAYGLMAAAYPTAQLVGAPILGRWSDSVGRRPILLLSQAGTLVAWIIFAAALFLPRTLLFEWRSSWTGNFSVTLPLLVLFLARGFDGLTGGNIAVANAYVADVSPEEERAVNFGRMGVSSNLGFVCGPGLAALMGLFGEGNYLLPLGACIAISALATGLVAFFLPESLHPKAPKCKVQAFGAGAKDSAGALARPRIRLLLTTYFLVFLGFNFFYTAFPVHAAGGLGWTVTRTGLFFVLLSALMIGVQGPGLAWIQPHASPRSLVVGGSLSLTLTFLLIRTGAPGPTFAAALFFALGNGLMWPSLQGLLSSESRPEEQGSVQGLAGSLTSAAAIFGLVAGGFVFERIGTETFGLSALFMLAAGLGIALFDGRLARPSAPAASG